MTALASVTLGRVLDHLGLTLLSQEAGRTDPGRAVASVALYDPAESMPDAEALRDALVLGVGVTDSEQITTLVRSLAVVRATGLLVRRPALVDPAVARTASELGVALLWLAPGASWMHAARLITSVLEERGILSHLEDPNGIPQQDLFDRANALADLLQAPVTIENCTSRILAFSADQGHADEARQQSVLGHQVPGIYRDKLTDGGIFKAVYDSPQPVFVPSLGPGVRPRAAMRVRAGSELLGSIWAVVDEPLSPDRQQVLVEAANLVAVTLLRSRISLDTTTQLRRSAVGALIQGGPPAREAASRLGLPAHGGQILAAGSRNGHGGDPQTAADLERVSRALTTFLQLSAPTAVCAVLEETVYAVLPVRDASASTDGPGEQLARDFMRRTSGYAGAVIVGVGCRVNDPSQFDRSRQEAELALRVLRQRRSHDPERNVSTLPAVQVESLLLRLSDTLATSREELSGPVTVLRDYDDRHSSGLEDTLRAWLDAFGDVARAAQGLHVHQNTLRYRLRRIEEITGMDLGDADQRFGAMLQLRLFPRP